MSAMQKTTSPAKAHVVTASEAAEKAAKKAKLQAKRAKRAAKLQELQKVNPLKVNCVLTYREYKRFVENNNQQHPDAKLTGSWSEFCKFKAGSYHAYWMAESTKPHISLKTIERKKARLEAAKAKMAELEKELEALNQVQS